MPLQFQHIRSDLETNPKAKHLLNQIQIHWNQSKPQTIAIVNYLKRFAIPGKVLQMEELSFYLSKCRDIPNRAQKCSHVVRSSCQEIRTFLLENNIGVADLYNKLLELRKGFIKEIEEEEEIVILE
jgi:hypothetical protein